MNFFIAPALSHNHSSGVTKLFTIYFFSSGHSLWGLIMTGKLTHLSLSNCIILSNRQHLETTAVLIHQLPLEMVQKPDKWSYTPTAMGKQHIISQTGIHRVVVGQIPVQVRMYW